MYIPIDYRTIAQTIAQIRNLVVETAEGPIGGPDTEKTTHERENLTSPVHKTWGVLYSHGFTFFVFF